MNKLVIILDAAHGSDVAGKRSPDGRHREYKWSRDLISELKPKLKSKGFRVELSNPGETESGLGTRQRFTTNLKVDPGQTKFLLSIHNNAADMGDKWMNVRYNAIYTSPGQTQSDIFAESLFEDLKVAFKDIAGFPKFNRSNIRGNANLEANFGVLTGAGYSAALLEWLFQDNQEDVKLLEDKTINDLLVNTLVSALIKINNTL